MCVFKFTLQNTKNSTRKINWSHQNCLQNHQARILTTHSLEISPTVFTTLPLRFFPKLLFRFLWNNFLTKSLGTSWRTAWKIRSKNYLGLLVKKKIISSVTLRISPNIPQVFHKLLNRIQLEKFLREALRRSICLFSLKINSLYFFKKSMQIKKIQHSYKVSSGIST